MSTPVPFAGFYSSRFSRQRLNITAIQQDALLRLLYMQDMSVFSPEMLVFVDETGADHRNAIRKYGYSLRGKPMCNQTMLVRGERISAIACIAVDGLLDVMTVEKQLMVILFMNSYRHAHLLQHL